MGTPTINPPSKRVSGSHPSEYPRKSWLLAHRHTQLRSASPWQPANRLTEPHLHPMRFPPWPNDRVQFQEQVFFPNQSKSSHSNIETMSTSNTLSTRLRRPDTSKSSLTRRCPLLPLISGSPPFSSIKNSTTILPSTSRISPSRSAASTPRSEMEDVPSTTPSRRFYIPSSLNFQSCCTSLPAENTLLCCRSP